MGSIVKYLGNLFKIGEIKISAMASLSANSVGHILPRKSTVSTTVVYPQDFDFRNGALVKITLFAFLRCVKSPFETELDFPPCDITAI